MKQSPAKRHLNALARSGSESALTRPAHRGLSQTQSAVDLQRPQADLDLGRGGALQRTSSRGSLTKNLKQLPPLEAPTVHKNPRDRHQSEPRREKKESSKKDGGSSKNHTGYGATIDGFDRPAVSHGDSLEMDRLDQNAKALRDAAANKAAKASAKEQRAETSQAAQAVQACAHPENAADTAKGQDTQEAHEASSSECYFKPDPFGPFRDEKAPEKPAGPPPMSDAEKDLMGAVCSGDLKQAEALLSEHGPSLLSGHGGGGITTTAILYAAQGGNKEMCDLLVAHGGVQVLERGRDIKSRGPAEYAEKGGHGELASHLKTMQADAKVETKQETKKAEPTWRP